ncbi:MAG: DUF1501 domain-containing protein [Paracoccaceae bacterium]
MSNSVSRRRFLSRSLALGCSAAASPLVTPIALASAPWDMRLVVMILRGGMDGLDAVRPVGDPDFQQWRPSLAGVDGPDLNGFFSLHPALSGLAPLWQAGELGFVHAVATPYRDQRSHFDGQDLLEAGTQSVAGVRDGWLNRMLQEVSGVEAQTAFALGQGDQKVLLGPAPVSEWVPGADMEISPQATRLAERIMEDDPAFHAAFAEALMLSEGDAVARNGKAAINALRSDMAEIRGSAAHVRISEFAAERLRGDTRVVSFSLGGWDTHFNQKRNFGHALQRLADSIQTLRAGVGDAVWQKTAVLAMTEFGRTARENGSGGTDHGTGGAMIMAGGAVRGGRVFGDWPGLAEADLYARRDLMPTMDVRAPAAWIMRAMTGLDRSLFEERVFAGLDMGADPGFLR